MKWNIIIGTLVLGFGMVSQSFGYDLLDRMLGSKGCGCEAKTSCCDTKSGKNGSCQKNGSKDGSKNGACQKSRGGLFGSHGCGCDDGKGSKDGACQKGGKSSCDRGSLFDRIFACNRCCDSKGGKGGKGGKGDDNGKSCGCDDGKGASQKAGPVSADPPAPIVDPSAYLPSRRVVPVSTTVIR